MNFAKFCHSLIWTTDCIRTNPYKSADLKVYQHLLKIERRFLMRGSKTSCDKNPFIQSLSLFFQIEKAKTGILMTQFCVPLFFWVSGHVLVVLSFDQTQLTTAPPCFLGDLLDHTQLSIIGLTSKLCLNPWADINLAAILKHSN